MFDSAKTRVVVAGTSQAQKRHGVSTVPFLICYENKGLAVLSFFGFVASFFDSFEEVFDFYIGSSCNDSFVGHANYGF